MILINEEELNRHQAEAHLKGNYQCQSCNRIFEHKDSFSRHAIEMHGGEKQLEANFAMIHRFKDDVDDVESMVLRTAGEE